MVSWGCLELRTCLRHVRENLVIEDVKHGVRCDASKELVTQIGYAPMALEYDVTMEELRSYKIPLAA